jgi:AGCS family alanine or glycine:cation symporter
VLLFRPFFLFPLLFFSAILFGMDFKDFITHFNHNFTLYIIFPAIILFGFYLSMRLRFMQIFQLKNSFGYLTKKCSNTEGSISRFEALSAVLAGNFGTGNISGMAVAIATGGPGALVWMWIMAFFGAAIQYASCILGIMFRTKTSENEFAGGPMYYLKDGLGYSKLAVIFSLCTIFGAITVGNLAQINSIILPLEKMGYHPFYCSLTIAFLVGIVILGGIKRLAYFASYVVPFKAVLYLATAFTIIFLNADQIIPAFKLMFQHAFGYNSVAGGVLGFGVLKAITTGFDRGLFATDAGTGIVPILQASAHSEHPVIDGISTLIAPLMVMIVCTSTGLVLIITGVWQSDLQSTNMVTHAFSVGLGTPYAGHIVVVSLILFAYTTILAWSYCGEKALEFLIGSKRKHWFRFLFIALVPLGGLIQVNMIWTLADLAISLMLFINLIGVVGLSKQVIDASREFHKISSLT